MVTWLTFSQLVWVLAVSQTSIRQEHRILSHCVRTFFVVFSVVPLIYTVGWLLLPAYNIGDIPFGGRR